MTEESPYSPGSPLVTRDGVEVRKICETYEATSGVSLVSRDGDGKIQIDEYDGMGAEIYWECGEPKLGADGCPLWMTDDGEEVSEVDLLLPEEYAVLAKEGALSAEQPSQLDKATTWLWQRSGGMKPPQDCREEARNLFALLEIPLDDE